MSRALKLAAAPMGLVIGAAVLGSRALFAGALGLVVVLVGCAVVVAVAARRIVVERSIDRREVVEGQPVGLTFDVRGAGGLPVQVEVQGAGGEWIQALPGPVSTSWVVDRPGGHAVRATPARIRDALGLVSRSISVGHPESLLVLPAPAMPIGGERRGGPTTVGDPEPDGLRPYVRGTPMSRVHWPAAARGVELQERVFVTGRDRLPLVVVDTSGAGEGPSLDWAARVAAGHVLTLSRRGGCRVLLPGDRVPTTVGDAAHEWTAMHRRIAALEPGTAARQAGHPEPGTIRVEAARAPQDALVDRAALPPGVVALAHAGAVS